MRILLVYPEFPLTYWGLQHARRMTGKQASLPPLGLITVASLLPREWELRLIDENIEALTDEDLSWADVVLVGGMLIQGDGIRQVVRRARALGKRTVVGGPAPSTSPESFVEADVVFGGEVESREAELIALIMGETANPGAGCGRQSEPVLVPLRKDGRPDLKTSPVPRFDLLRLSAYMSMAVQYSRGCPYRCEFCDIIEIFGRVPRVKQPEQVLAELDALYQLGWRGSLFVVDDNFIGNIRQVEKLLPQLSGWQGARGHPFQLYTEASLNLATKPALIEDMVGSGFTGVFLGIETPTREALEAAKKLQNLRLDMRDAVDTLTAAGLEVMGGFIVGLDDDDPTALEAQHRFLADAPIPLAMVGVLTALPGTALWRRLTAEGRMRSESPGEQFARPNFVPAMDEESLLEGYGELLSRLYSIDGYTRRCRAYLARAQSRGPTHGLRRGWARILARTLWHLGIANPRRRLLWSLVWSAVIRSPRHVPWAIEKAIQGEHFMRYTDEDVLPRLREATGEVRREREEARVHAGERANDGGLSNAANA